MPEIRRGEVWLVDLGMAANARPAVVFNIPFLDNERAVYTTPTGSGLNLGNVS